MAITGPRFFRYFLLAEAGSTVLTGAIPLMLWPESVLSGLLTSPSQMTPATLFLGRWLGAFLCGFSGGLVYGYPNTPRAVATRRIAQYSILAAELAVVPINMSYIMNGGSDSGLAQGALVGLTGFVGLFISTRCFFLFVKPEWMEATDEGKKLQ